MELSSSAKHHLEHKKNISLKAVRQPLSYKPAFELDFVERLLGRRKKSGLPRSTRRRLTTQKNRLKEIIKPRLIWKEYQIDKIKKNGVMLAGDTFFSSRKMAHALQGAEKVIVFIATVGTHIDHEIESLISGGELANGYIADALGSGAVEKLADRFHTDTAQELGIQNYTVGLRFSPGYCDWPVTDQKKLFSLLNTNALGVNLSDTALMQPRKSISGVFGIYKNTTRSIEKNFNPCRRCWKTDCIARRVEALPPRSH